MTFRKNSTTKPILFVVDDDSALCTALKFALELDGFVLRTFSRPSILLECTDLTAANCFIIDYRLPEMDGLELLNRLRKLHVIAPAVLITSNPSPSVRAKAKAAGVPIVEKPLLNNTLSERVHLMLSKAR